MVMTSQLTIRPLEPADRQAWAPLWLGYLDFYRATVPPEVTELNWSRLHDPCEPVHGYGAFLGDGALAAIAHLILHRSMWTAGPYCYLQDLFTAPFARRQGIARALIEHACAEAQRLGASRIYWLTHESNEAARRLYDTIADRSGFIQYRKIF
jgi:GNAT superfamily N-acetyltransferase